MKINFYEEFPNKTNLKKVKSINFPFKLYVAAPSLEKYLDLEKNIKKLNKKATVGWWPTLKKEEGYWFSPFSKRKAILRIIDQITSHPKTLDIMWDVEFPSQKKSLLLTELPNFFRNKKTINNFFSSYSKNITTSENLGVLLHLFPILKLLGGAFSLERYKHKKIVMYYTSMHGRKPTCLKTIKKLVKQYPERIAVALGTLSKGILGTEPILSHIELARDLIDMKKLDVAEIYIFRLEGLTEPHLKVIKELL